MREQEISEGLGELADVAEKDHEVQMARAELYKLAKYAIKLHDMLKGVSEAEGLEGWVQSKITKSADMIGSVYHHMDYDQSPLGEVTEAKDTHCSDKCCGADTKAEDCTCPPSCEHCNCNAVNEAGKGIEAMKKAGNAKADAEEKEGHDDMATAIKKKAKKDYKESLQDKLQAKMDEVAGPDKCWPGYKKDGTQKGTGKNKGKRVNKCVKA